MSRLISNAGKAVLGVVLAAGFLGCTGMNKLRAENTQLKEQVVRLSDALAADKSETGRLSSENAKLRDALAKSAADTAAKNSELEKMRGNLAGQGFDVSLRAGTVVVTLPTNILYGSGSAVLSAAGKEKLRRLTSTLNTDFKDYTIEVRGHTDTEPIRKTRNKYKSNWELSYDRAQTVVYYLIKDCNIKPERVRAAACGQYDPVASNKTPEGRAKNRRVEIVVVKPPAQ